MGPHHCNRDRQRVRQRHWVHRSVLEPVAATMVLIVKHEGQSLRRSLHSHAGLRHLHREVTAEAFLRPFSPLFLLSLLVTQAKALDFFHHSCTQLNEYRIGFGFQLLTSAWYWHNDIIYYARGSASQNHDAIA